MAETTGSERIDHGRRTFLKISALAGGGLLIGFHLPALRQEVEAAPASGEFTPNAWIRVGADDSVTLQVASSEMGQGVMTAIPMLLADELECDWSRVRVEHAPARPEYKNPIFGRQATGGSTAIRGYWTSLREAGAAGRELLVSAAALTWGVNAEACRAEKGVVMHTDSGRRLRYGELAAKAATLQLPDGVLLKDPSEFRLIGKSTPRKDTPAKVNGRAIFGQDVKIPGMLTATVARCPVFGGKLKSFDASAAKAVKGVRHVLPVSGGVAVVADDFWAAKRGRDALAIEWDEGPAATISSHDIARQFAELEKHHGVTARAEGDVARALSQVSQRVEAVYEVPYLAHACMEPMNCTAHVRRDGCDVWVPTQAQTDTQATAARIAGLTPEQVQVHTTFLGGGFGRRSEMDFVVDAVELSKATRTPVKVIWTREDDIQHDFYRPATYNRLVGGIDRHGKLLAWQHQIVGPSILARRFPDPNRTVDRTSTEGAANIPYAIPNLHVSYVMADTPVPVGFWRSVGSSQNAFITECFFDELAATAGKDPYEWRRAMLAAHPRHLGVLELAATKAGWGKALPRGRHRGIAVAESFKTFVAQVAEVSLEPDKVRVHRVVCAIDCGMVVNPDTIAAQMESGIVYGLTAAFKGEITIKNGRVEQSNFHDYPLLRIDEMPQVEVHIVPSREAPSGVGEPGTPPIAPAVANAVFAATGQPVRRLPMRV